MEKTSTLVHNVFDNTKDYVSLKTRSLKLQAYEVVADTTAGTVNGLILGVTGFLAFVFINVGLAYALSEAFNSVKWGFLALGGIYLVIAGVFLAAKKAIDLKIKNKLVTKLSKDEFKNYELMLSEKKQVDAKLERAETLVKGNIEELKANAGQLAEDFRKLKEDVQRFKHIFEPHHQNNASQASEPHSPAGEQGQSPFKKIALSAITELLINRFVIKDVQSIKKVIVPVLLKAFMSGNSGGENGSKENGGFLNTLKAKLEKFM